jgi:hypothetical protein
VRWVFVPQRVTAFAMKNMLARRKNYLKISHITAIGIKNMQTIRKRAFIPCTSLQFGVWKCAGNQINLSK